MDPVRIAAARNLLPVPDPAPGAVRLWPMMPSLASVERMHKLERRRPPRFAVANKDAIFDAMRAVDEQHPKLSYAGRDALYFAASPAVQLLVTEPRFAPNHLWPNIHLASARLCAAFDLPPEVIEYGAVDASGSTEAVRAADYRTFRVVQQADPVDLARACTAMNRTATPGATSAPRTRWQSGCCARGLRT